MRCGLLAPLLEYLKLVALPSLRADSSDRGGSHADGSEGAAAMLALPQLLALGEVEEVRQAADGYRSDPHQRTAAFHSRSVVLTG